MAGEAREREKTGLPETQAGVTQRGERSRVGAKETQEQGTAQFSMAQPRLPTLSSLGKLQHRQLPCGGEDQAESPGLD